MNYSLSGLRLPLLYERRYDTRGRLEDALSFTLIFLGLSLDTCCFIGATLANCIDATMDSFLRFLRIVLLLGELGE